MVQIYIFNEAQHTHLQLTVGSDSFSGHYTLQKQNASRSIFHLDFEKGKKIKQEILVRVTLRLFSNYNKN